MQSLVLIAIAIPLLLAEAVESVPVAGSALAAAISVAFALLVWRLRAATSLAAACGGLICFAVTARTAQAGAGTLQSGLMPLMLLFALTFLATRAGRRQKRSAGLAESRRGRTASQVVANLGAAAFVLALPVGGLAARFGPRHSPAEVLPVLALAALVEATADTVSSEIGQAFGGTPFLLTSFARVPPGMDGAVSLRGTVAGLMGALLVTAAGAWSLELDVRATGIALAGGLAGFLFDSLLGATVERRGWLGNDLVNFVSTVFAAAVALCLLLF